MIHQIFGHPVIGTISLRIQNPVFESQTKTRLGSTDMGPDGPTVRIFINDFIKRELDNYLHQNPDVAESLLKRIMQSERERKDMAGIKKLANQRAKKANLHNKKLRDCRVHMNDEKADEEKKIKFHYFYNGRRFCQWVYNKVPGCGNPGSIQFTGQAPKLLWNEKEGGL